MTRLRPRLVRDSRFSRQFPRADYRSPYRLPYFREGGIILLQSRLINSIIDNLILRKFSSTRITLHENIPLYEKMIVKFSFSGNSFSITTCGNARNFLNDDMCQTSVMSGRRNVEEKGRLRQRRKKSQRISDPSGCSPISAYTKLRINAGYA